ncbi:hypothetical protein [Pseudoalteromonas sp. A3]|uniref:hypothetical protein n=1 Tax=Pseudoalteromonas sp. A3 TaxID=142792 RepID=UPI0039B5DA31
MLVQYIQSCPRYILVRFTGGQYRGGILPLWYFLSIYNHAQSKSLLSNKQGGLKLIFTVLLILTTEPLLHTIKASPKLVLIPT